MNIHTPRSNAVVWAGMHLAALGAVLGPWPAPARAGLLTTTAVSWDGSCGNSFWASQCGSMTNWNNDQQTTLGDDVSIGPGDPVVNIVFDAQANSLTCESGLWIDAALELAGSGAIRDLTLSSIAQRALDINAGQVTLTGTTNWEQGRVGGAGVLRNESMMTGYMQMVDTTTFVNATQATMRGGFIDANAVAINSQGALFTLRSTAVGAQNSLSGPGMFVNHGTLEHQHLANAIIHMDCPYLQDTGNFDVNTTSVTNAQTHFRHSATFSGGEFTIAGDAHVYLLVPGSGGVYTFDGLPAVTGNGNLHLSTPTWSEVRVVEDLQANLTGTDGLVLDGIFLNLGAAIKNHGKAKLVRSAIRPIDPPGGDGIDIPQLTNEPGATMRLVAPGIATTIDVWLRNKPGAIFVHETGGLIIDNDGVVTNEGTYEHRRGSISLAQGATGAFDNRGTYVRPDHPNTMNDQVQAPFVLSPGSLARFEKATTEFAHAIGSGTFFLGGDMEIWENALVRVGGGSCEQADSRISGLGQYHFGGWIGGAIIFNIEDQRVLRCDLGPDSGDGGGELGGVYLDQQSRIAGLGELRNLNQLFWNGGSIASSGEGRVRNAITGTTFLTSGYISPGGEFINEGSFFAEDGFPAPAGFVKQAGTLTLQDGFVTNYGFWRVETGSHMQGFGTHEFFNSEIGLFQNAIPPAQTTSINVRFDNLGLVHAFSGTLAFSNVVQVSGNTLTGGRWEIEEGATLDLPGFLTIIGIGARVDCDGTFNDVNTVVANLGTLNVRNASFNQSLTNSGTMGVNGNGTTQIQGGNGNVNNQPPTALFYANTQVVPSIAGGGDGGPVPVDLRCANFNNSGLVGPGGPAAAGPFSLNGNFNQSSTGILQIELAGTTPVDEHDQLIVDGNVALDGTLQARVLPGYAPQGGEQFTIITASNGTISGTFDQVVGHGQYSLLYSPTSVTLTLITPPQAGDITGDGVVNIDDLLAVIAGWGACAPPPAFCVADVTGDGVVNIDDLLLVISNWG